MNPCGTPKTQSCVVEGETPTKKPKVVVRARAALTVIQIAQPEGAKEDFPILIKYGCL